MKRCFDPDAPEFVDCPRAVTPELERELRDLEAINRRFGSHRLVRRFLDLWFNPGRCYRVLDLCTGGADVVRNLADWARTRDVTLRIDALDASEACLELARRASSEYPEIRFISGDVRTFESTESYDLVLCTQSLHHFSEEDAATVLRQCRALSHRYVLVADFERSWVTLLGAQVITSLFYPEPATRADAAISARRAFSFHELRALAEAADWPPFGHSRFLVCRQAIWLDGRDVADIPLADAEGLPCPT